MSKLDGAQWKIFNLAMRLIDTRSKVSELDSGRIETARSKETIVQFSAGILSVFKLPRQSLILKVSGDDVLGPKIRNLDNEWLTIVDLEKALVLDDLAAI